MQLSETQYGQNEDCYDPGALNTLSIVYKQTMKTGKYVKKQENRTETITEIERPSDEIRRLEINNTHCKCLRNLRRNQKKNCVV